MAWLAPGRQGSERGRVRLANILLLASLASGLVLLVTLWAHVQGVHEPPALRAALGEEGLEFDAGDDYTIAEDHRHPQGGTRSLLAAHGDTRIRVRVVADLDAIAAEAYLQEQSAMLESLFLDRQAPYPGQLSRSLQCPDALHPQEHVVDPDGPLRRLWGLHANDRLAYGVCSEDLVSYRAAQALFVCPAARIAGTFEVFMPRDVAPDAPIQIAQALRCTAKTQDGRPTSSPTAFATDGIPCEERDVPGCAVWIAGGSFWMGSQRYDSHTENYHDRAERNESPVHEVSLSPYRIDRYEVTVAQYRQCVDAGECTTPGTIPYCNWAEPDREDHPINCVDFDQSDAYCRWAGGTLPSEAQWEYAARGTDGRIYPWGNDPPTCERAVYHRCDSGHTLPVGTHPAGASPFGIQDMAGGVWEWTTDWYDPDYYEYIVGSDPQGPERGTVRVKRGGSWWNDWEWRMVTSTRYWLYPGFWSDNQGLRCVYDAATPHGDEGVD